MRVKRKRGREGEKKRKERERERERERDILSVGRKRSLQSEGVVTWLHICRSILAFLLNQRNI